MSRVAWAFGVAMMLTVVACMPTAAPEPTDAAVQYLIDNAPDDEISAQMASFDFTDVIDNSIVARLVDDSFFEDLFGADILADQDEKAESAFGQ